MIARLPKGTGDQTRCVAWATSDGWHRRQCSRPRGHGEGGDWCKQHANMIAEQAAKKARQEEQHLAWDAERKANDEHEQAVVDALVADPPRPDTEVWDLIAKRYNPISDPLSFRSYSFVFEGRLDNPRMERLKKIIGMIDEAAEVALIGKIKPALFKLGLRKLRQIVTIVEAGE